MNPFSEFSPSSSMIHERKVKGREKGLHFVSTSQQTGADVGFPSCCPRASREICQ